MGGTQWITQCETSNFRVWNLVEIIVRNRHSRGGAIVPSELWLQSEEYGGEAPNSSSICLSIAANLREAVAGDIRMEGNSGVVHAKVWNYALNQ
jgi:hypothetical protein